MAGTKGLSFSALDSKGIQNSNLAIGLLYMHSSAVFHNPLHCGVSGKRGGLCLVLSVTELGVIPDCINILCVKS